MGILSRLIETKKSIKCRNVFKKFKIGRENGKQRGIHDISLQSTESCPSYGRHVQCFTAHAIPLSQHQSFSLSEHGEERDSSMNLI